MRAADDMALAGCLLCLALLVPACNDSEPEDSVHEGTDDDSAVDDDSAPGGPDDDSSDDDDDDASPPEYPESCPSGPALPFDLASKPMVVPFPNDLYTVEDGSSPSGRRVRIDQDTARPLGALAASPFLRFLTDAYNGLTGFSTLADLYLPTGVEPDPASLPDALDPSFADGLFLMADDAASPYDGELTPLASDFRSPDLHLTPWFPLREKTHYALVATRALRPPGGCFRASASMREVWSAWATGSGDQPAARYRDVLERLDGLGVAPDQVLSIADFTTGWITREMESAVEVLDDLALSAPASFRDWEIVPDADPRLWATAHATFDAPIFKPKGGAWALDEAGRPVVDHVEAIRAYFTIPAADATPNGQPYPILLFEHGIFNDKHEMRPPFTTEIAALGFATVGIDAVCHGDRLPPGVGDIGQFLCFYDILHPNAWRDNFRESAADVAWLRRALTLLADVDLDDNGVPDFDVTRVYNLGVSFGSILGGIYAGVERQVDAHVLSAAGAKFISIALEGEAAEYIGWIEALENWLLPGEPITDFLHLALDMVQAILDPADSANYLIHALDDPLEIMQGHRPQILQQGAAWDDVIGGPAGGWLCRAADWPQMTPFAWDVGAAHVSAPFQGSAFYQFDTDEHTLMFDEDPLSEPTRAQVFHFLQTRLDDGIGEIIDPLADSSQ
jgi:hypothetical protein